MTDQELLRLEDQAFVEQAYVEALGRASDPAGLSNYLGRVRRGVAKVQVLAELRASDEGQRHAAKTGRRVPPPAAHPTSVAAPATLPLRDLLRLGDEAFVEQAYRLTLGRGADESGRANYLRELHQGVSRLEVLHELLQSAEGQRVNAPLPQLRALIARRRVHRLPGVRHALRALRRVSMHLRDPRAPAASMRAVTIPSPHSLASEGQDPLRPRAGARRGSRSQPNPSIMSTTSTDPAAHPNGGRLEAATADAATWTQDPGAAGQEPGAQGGTAGPQPCNLHAERLVGPVLHGWSAIGGQPAACTVSLAARALGRVVPDVARPEIQATHALADPVVGFAPVLGGLLQFAAMAPSCSTLQLRQQGEGGTAVDIDLQQHLPEALTFSPMRALLRPLLRQAGQIRSMRLVSPTEASVVFEADTVAGEPAPSIYIDFYQEPAASPGTLQRVARFGIELGGQLHDLSVRLLDVQRPLLMVVTDDERAIVATDCFPLPVLFAESHAALIEYHVTLESGKSTFGVVAKIARTFLDAAIQARQLRPQRQSPLRDDTCLVLYSRGDAEAARTTLLGLYAPLAAEVVVLDARGSVQGASGPARPLAEHVASSRARHFLLHDAQADLRPDFWAVIDSNDFRLAGAPAVVHWHALWIDGVSRPQVVKAGLLLHPAFAGHALLEARSLLVARKALERAVSERGEQLASGRLVLERAFDFVEPQDVVCLPLVMHTVRTPLVPLQVQRYRAEHTILPMHPAQAARAAAEVQVRGGAGVSVVINYRDSVHDTLRCLESLATQQLDGPLEVVLVNNGSTPASVDTVVGRARTLFGREGVKAIDYPHRFNHSTQCNVAAVAARHDLLLMLSNDSVLMTPRAVARSAAVARVPWIGSVGFRIVGGEASKRRLQSLGLALNPRRYLFSGGSPVSTNLAPPFALDCTFEVVGNTFAAVMLRRDVYQSLDGLDSDAFPTSYNDVDFSFRATNAGYRHVVIGSEVVEHVGRGSREADQDLPIDQRIIERAPRLDLLARVGFQQL